MAIDRFGALRLWASQIADGIATAAEIVTATIEIQMCARAAGEDAARAGPVVGREAGTRSASRTVFTVDRRDRSGLGATA